jgi:hypothetical protein
MTMRNTFAKGLRKNNLAKCRVILREPWRPKNPLGVQEILQSPGLPQDDRNASKLYMLFLRGP